ncbi:hypothetical protein ILFOPFJJ_06027 [Ensifer psoraleae]|uniref:type III secretion apparatus assembly protein SctX n=1 Tax=Sinorhizobium psoraleae TaxID=520838 RepID=UPI0024ABA4D4|nr:hypothetical protein [Sinorhizobium psoraleae]
MVSSASHSSDFFARSASLLAGVRQSGTDAGSLIRTEHVVPLLGARGAPVTDIRPHFELLYNAPSANDLMIAAFAPPITDPGILQSATYVATLEAAHASVADLAAQTADSESAVYRDALSVLDQARCDRLLLDNSCRALMRG